MLRFSPLLMVGLLLSVGVSVCPAHDLKVMPELLSVESGGEAAISLSWGHLLPFDAPIDARALDRYELRSPGGSVITLRSVGVSNHTNRVTIREEGIYHAIATRKPTAFTVLVDKDGRHRHHRGPKSSVRPEDGRIDHAAFSHQYACSLIVSGPAGDEPVKRAGLPLEIVPLQAPAGWRSGRDLQFQVLFQGKPVPQEELVVSIVGLQPTADADTDTDTDAGLPASPPLVTDARGIAVVSAAQPGTWVLRVRLRRTATDKQQQPEYDVESHTSTLVMEVRP